MNEGMDRGVLLSLLREEIAKRHGPQLIEPDTKLLDADLIDDQTVIDLTERIGDAFNIKLRAGTFILDDFTTPEELWRRIGQLKAATLRPPSGEMRAVTAAFVEARDKKLRESQPDK